MHLPSASSLPLSAPSQTLLTPSLNPSCASNPPQKKVPVNWQFTGIRLHLRRYLGGKKGIRTPETLLRFTRFPGGPVQPLLHLSFRFAKVIIIFRFYQKLPFFLRRDGRPVPGRGQCGGLPAAGRVIAARRSGAVSRMKTGGRSRPAPGVPSSGGVPCIPPGRSCRPCR